ncbi:MAG TPA: hypothetical protein VLK58_14970, partial [Conexibacter sp.]|nr:hypothetical protein [Conexibacter sp.]
RHGDKPLWRLVEPPTTDRRELTDALARIGPRAGAPAATSYGRLLYDLLDDEQVRWRAGAQRGVVFLLRDLPSQRELDGSPGASADAIPVDGDWTRACSRFLDAWEPREVAADRAQAVRWGEALAKHCERNAARREWQLNGRLAERPAPHSVALHAFTGERRPRRTHAWTGWANALDGTFARHRPAHGPVDAVRLLREARDAQTGVPFGELKRLTEIFQPHVRFDESEQFLPVDVDRLLTEGGHRVCDRHGAGGCERVASARDLTGALDEFLDLSGGARGGRDLVGRSDPSRMYVHVREHRGQVYLGYWWFQRFNSSPWRPEVNCLPGLTSSVSCFDHEGDWEGVTVVLDLVRERLMHHRYARANVEPVAALYDSHGHPIRWRWDDLERTADDGSAATHPVVYAAAGSHASYPVACRSDECSQRLAHSIVPDGGFDGGKAWLYDARRDRCEDGAGPADRSRIRPCLLALPSTRDGTAGVLWNAFPGRWGAAVCADLARICSQIDGPRSPSLQPRFRRPWEAKDGPREKLARARPGPAAADEPPE